MSCPACGADVPEGSRFCPACGHGLAAAASRGEQRRVATVLFADLVGFTALSESRDPEQVKRLVDRCFKKLSADIAAYGGVVDKIIGDAIVALFGAPVAHEDDPERAVRAALAMQRTLSAEAVELDAPVQMRIGVNTGEVVVGSVAGGGYTAMGDVVNTASRLQTAAPPGGVLVGPLTWAATRTTIRYRDLGRLEARGRVAPVDAWQAEAAVLPPGYRHRRHTPLVGRDEELGMLQHALNAAVERSRGHLIVLLGEAGVGKTRLAEEVADTAEALHGATVLEGRCVPYGEANVWWPVAEAVRDAVGLAADAPPEVARLVVAGAVEATVGSESGGDELAQVTEGLLFLLGYDGPLGQLDPQRARDEARRAVLSFIEASCAVRPVVVILSDLHWADPVVLDMIDSLMDRLCRLPFVLLATARPDLVDRWAARPGRHNQVSLTLDPLDGEATAVLLDRLVEGDLSAEVADVLLARSGGNPFFLEELVALLEGATPQPSSEEDGGDGVAAVEAAAATLEAAAQATPAGDDRRLDHLPDTLRGLVTARLDGLPRDERRLLEDAAVWGRSGKIDALVRMGEHDDRPRIDDALSALVDKELLVVDRDGWRFRSDLVRDVAYSTLTKATRARTHHGIAYYLESHGPDPRRADEWLVDVVAHHYAHAAELVAEVGLLADVDDAELVERALCWVEEAAARARGSQVYPVSIRMFSQALGLVGPAGSERRADLLLSRATAYAESRRLAEARRDLGEAEVLSAELGFAPGLARAAFVRGLLAQFEGRLDEAVAELGEARQLYRDLGDRTGEADTLRNIGLTEIFRQDLEASEASIGEALDLYRGVEDRRGEAWSLQQMAWISFMENRADEADERLARAAATFTELGDGGGLAWVRGLSAYVRFQQGDLVEARRLGDDALREAQARGDRWAEGMMLLLAGSVRLWSGRTSEALGFAQQALDLFAQIGDRFGSSQAQFLHGRVLVMLGRMADGFRTLEAAPSVFDSETSERVAGGVLAAVAVQVGDPHRAASAVSGTGPAVLDPRVFGDADRLVAIGLTRLQCGEVEEATELLTLAAESGRPAALAALALGEAAVGSRDSEVFALHDQVESSPRATYLDRAYAALAAALVRARWGEPDAADALEDLVDAAGETDDVLLEGLAHLARARGLAALGSQSAADAEARATAHLTDVGLPLTGWARVIDGVLDAAARAEDSGALPA
jgi:class 3 adenylate cyclase/tetratricopeptide (TPR) repeat protein